MSINFLTEEQVKRSLWGRFNDIPDITQLGGFFRLDATGAGRWPPTAPATSSDTVQLGTVRYLNCFLDNPEDVPAAVVDYVAEQLGLDAAALKEYGDKEARWDHQKQIREDYGYTVFEGEQWFALACWLYRRAWSTNDPCHLRPVMRGSCTRLRRYTITGIDLEHTGLDQGRAQYGYPGLLPAA
jgi:Domain of unknown function (DUF4158)